MIETTARHIPETPRDERVVMEKYIGPLAIEVQQDYYAHLRINTDEAVMDWIIENSEAFRRAFNEVLKEVLKEEDFADAIEQARNGDDHILRSVILAHVTELLKPHKPQL